MFILLLFAFTTSVAIFFCPEHSGIFLFNLIMSAFSISGILQVQVPPDAPPLFLRSVLLCRKLGMGVRVKSCVHFTILLIFRLSTKWGKKANIQLLDPQDHVLRSK